MSEERARETFDEDVTEALEKRCWGSLTRRIEATQRTHSAIAHSTHLVRPDSKTTRPTPAFRGKATRPHVLRKLSTYDRYRCLPVRGRFAAVSHPRRKEQRSLVSAVPSVAICGVPYDQRSSKCVCRCGRWRPCVRLMTRTVAGRRSSLRIHTSDKRALFATIHYLLHNGACVHHTATANDETKQPLCMLLGS